MRFTKIVLPLLLAVICLATTAFVWRSAPTKNGEVPKTRLADSFFLQSSGERGPVRMIRFVAFNEGLRPSEIRVQQGLINIALEDKTGVSDGLQVERVVNDQREKVIQIGRLQNHWRGRELVRLMPGNYIVYDASQPDNKATLIVEPEP